MAKRQTKTTKKQTTTPSWIWLGGAVILIAVVIGIFALGNPGGANTQGLPLEISVAQAAEKRDAGAFILDVREPDEWNEVHIPGATLIPLGQLNNRLSEVPTDQEVVVVCRSGNRSQTGRDILRNAGFTDVTSMAGGMNQWKALGFPTATGP